MSIIDGKEWKFSVYDVEGLDDPYSEAEQVGAYDYRVEIKDGKLIFWSDKRGHVVPLEVVVELLVQTGIVERK